MYNTLNLFSRQGIVREVAVDPTHLVYDSTTAAHHHFFNIDTGELTDIDSDSWKSTACQTCRPEHVPSRSS